MKKYLLLIGFFWLFISDARSQLIQGSLKAGGGAGDIEVWLKPNFTNSTQYLFQIGMPIAFPVSASPVPTALINVSLDPGFVAAFGSNYSVTVNPVATATGGTEKYFNIVLVRGGVGASNAQSWTAGAAFKVLTATFSPAGSPATPVKLADYQDGGSDGLGNFYTQSGNNDYFITTNSVGNFYAIPGQSIVGGTATAGYAQTIGSIPMVCAAPSIPTVTNITATTADINWGVVSGAVGYEYEVSTSATAPTSGTATTGTTYNANGLTASTAYYIHVRTNCGTGDYSSWVKASFNTQNPSCATPLGLAVNNIGTTTADINWNTVSGAVGYEYAITTSATAPTSGTAITGTVYNATGLIEGTTYYAHVRSNCGAGSFSTWVSILFNTAFCPATTLPVITNITPTTATVSWTAVSGVAGYEYAVTNSATPPASGTATSSTTYSATGLVPGTTYYVYIRSSCSAGIFSAWALKSFTTPYPICVAPSLPEVTNISSSADISWGAVSGTTGYEYAVTTSSAPPASGTATTSTTYHVTGLSPVTQYYAHVRSNCGAGGFSEWVKKVFITPCFAPVIMATVHEKSAVIFWNSVLGADGYEYAFTTYPTPPLSGISITDTSYQLNNLSAGVGYYFHVRTHCAPGDVSDWSSYGFHMPGLDAYPNPVRNSLRINLYGGGGDGQVSLYDAAGKLVRRILMTNNTVTLDTRGLAGGVYLIRYVDGERRYTLKVMKE